MYYIILFSHVYNNKEIKTKQICFNFGNKSKDLLFDEMIKDIWAKYPKAKIFNGLIQVKHEDKCFSEKTTYKTIWSVQGFKGIPS